MGTRGLEALSDTLHSLNATAHQIANIIEDNAGYLHSDLENNRSRIDSQIDDQLKALGIRGPQALEVRDEVFGILNHASGIPFDSEWFTSSTIEQ